MVAQQEALAPTPEPEGPCRSSMKTSSSPAQRIARGCRRRATFSDVEHATPHLNSAELAAPNAQPCIAR
jgi:hypothetical protein